MSRVVFLLEEYSMKVFLDSLLPRLAPGLEFLCIPHEGKQDLQRSIPRKLRAWREPGVRFVVVHDNDGGDCRDLKASLQMLCAQGRREDTLVRIPCQELEAWYLGDLPALGVAYGDPALPLLARKAKYRDPDQVQRPSFEVSRLVPAFQKVSGARLLSTRLDIALNRSGSFQVFASGVAGLDRAGS